MTHRSRLCAVLLLPLSLLAGCGDDDSTAAPSPTVTVTETATPTPEPPESPTVTPTTTEVSPTPTPPPTDSVEPTKSAGSDGPAVDLSQPPRTYDDALAHFDAVGSEPMEFSRFETPSGNIYCVLDDDVIPPSCELGQGAIKDPGTCGPDGPTQFVGRLEFTGGRATAICNTDTIRTPSPPILGYTAAARFAGGDVQCLSEQIGVTCISLSRTEGFFLRKGQYVIFNAG